MIARSSTTPVLIIDRDLGFLMWLGELFQELGYQAFPALSCRQGLTLARQLNADIAVLVLNPELRGARRVVDVLRSANREVRVIWIRESGAVAECSTATIGSINRMPSVLERPLPSEPVCRSEWKARIRKVLL